MSRPSYPRAMKERAKKDGKSLVTVDVPGLCFQGPVSKKHVKEAIMMLTRWFKQRGKKKV
jgi:hypothetical protein